MKTASCFGPAHILLPGENIPLEKWGCVACDQFTSDRAYWEQADAVVGGCPSTLRLILPEVYLEDKDAAQRVENIHAAMDEYSRDVLTRAVDGFVYVERTEQSGRVRQGLVGKIDLEAYSYEKGARPAIRPSERTVTERIPPRMAVRRGAALETPHVMMLADDPGCTLVEPIGAHKSELKKLYEGELMQGGAAPLTLAVGDGNHSLAAAKACWEELKATLTPEERESHPARWCLAEVCNVHSPAIEIEPIHRVLFNADCGAVLLALIAWSDSNMAGICFGDSKQQAFTLAGPHVSNVLSFEDPVAPLTVGTVDEFIEYFMARHSEARVDYVHDEPAVRALTRQGGVAFLLPPFEKSDLFKGIVMGGVLPRKTFSMGHAEEKRYYIECRKIIE